MNKEAKPEKKKIIVARSATEIQRLKLEKLLKNPSKLAYIPEKPTEKLPRAFNPPEFVRNIWGSSAGAGSGDFHVYRGVRRRENARQKYLDEKSKKDALDDEFKKKLEDHKLAAEIKSSKKKIKRLKKRANKNKSLQKKNQEAENINKTNVHDSEENLIDQDDIECEENLTDEND